MNPAQSQSEALTPVRIIAERRPAVPPAPDGTPWQIAELVRVKQVRSETLARLPFGELLVALSQASSIGDVARAVGVPEQVVRWRMRSLTDDEWEQVRAEVTVTDEQAAS